METETRVLIPIADVVIPDNRFREADPKKVEEIKLSLIEFGQLQPIILDDQDTLVDGLHRITAARTLGWDTVWYDLQTNLSDIRRREIELEVNIRRLDMSPAERINAIAEIHKLKREIDPNWGTAQTALLVGSNRKADISDAVNLSNMMKLFPELKEAKSISQMKSWAEAKAASISRVMEVRDNRIDYAEVESKIILGDSTEVIKTLPSNFIHAVITDPPFGIDYDSRTSGSEVNAVSSYEDSEGSYWKLLDMAPEIFRVLRPNGWCIWFFGISWYEECKQAFRSAGFTVDEIPIVWDRSDGRVYTNRPDRYFGRGYDLALHCIKGDPQVIQRGKSNVLRIPPVGQAEKELLVERPVDLYAELIRRLTVPGELVADFFTGSGSCLAAAASTGRDYLGVERDPERRAYAIKKVKAHTPQGK